MDVRKELIALLILFPLGISAQRTSFTYKGVNFKCKLNKQFCTITSFDVSADSVVIPSMIEYGGQQYPVKEVDTFINGNSYLARTLVIEEGIERIENFSFVEFRKLKEVYLPSTMKFIGKNAFRKNQGIVFNTPAQQNLADNQQSVKSEEQKPKPASKPVVKRKNIYSVDDNIPVGIANNEHTYCVVIANENYQEAPRVDCAKNDGNVFSEYCRQTLGIPDNQVRTFIDAGYTDVLRAIRFLENVQQFDKEAKLIFYYSGHGIPDEKDRAAYILPVDGSPKEMQTCVSLKTVYERLGKIKAKNITVLLDACFCGANRGNNEAILAARSIVRVKEDDAKGNMVVLSAASGDETAFALKDANHGLFTYYLLKQLKSTKGKVKLGELFREVKAGVTKSSVLENDKLQTPTVVYSPSMVGKWEDIYF